MAYITIVKGDDTDFLENQYIVVNFNTELELAGFQAIFNIDNIEIVYPDLSAKYIEIVLSKEVTAALKKGKIYGKLRIVDTQNRIRTVSTAIPFNIVTKVMNASQISKQSIQLEVSVTKNEFNVDMNILGLSKRVAQDYLTQMKQFDAKLTEKVQTVKNIEASINKTDENCQKFALEAKNFADQAAESAVELDNTISHINTTRASVALNNLNEDGIKCIQKNSSCAFEIGDIGIAPLGIDETQNKRRYLNGQIILQEQFVSFTQKLKAAVELYPSLVCTEQEWQAHSLLTVKNQCGKFVIDDEAGTIRLPKIIMPIQGLTDLSNLADIVEAGLPNITGNFKVYYAEGATGAFKDGTITDAGRYPSGNGGGGIYQKTFDASQANPIYDNSSTVQQEQIQYPYFIQVARGVEESIDVTREIELNNPFCLLDYKYSEYELNNISWLKSEGQFNSRSVYPSAYELLLKIHNNIECKNGISVKLTSEEFTDYDFVLNTADESFKLPTSVANSQNGYLYFYVGETTQNANLINIGRIQESCSTKSMTDGQWVISHKTLAGSVSVTSDIKSLTYDLSDYLPNDGYNYEVIFETNAVTGNVSAQFMFVSLRTDYMLSAGLSGGIYLCNNRTRAASYVNMAGNANLPVGTGRSVDVVFNQSSANFVGSFTLWVIGYRRIGTNL